ncbi:hypothetical protein CPB83DRAFT_858854 [Crepidotus variabilis]|uniref:BTB domain-containing protein n=1 Tax=Crepidotus variabilis TaxID=179855 RepID=A0A9P6EB14_9AGAR|nr:hypothetical protein CPB83DRAFT_858854 [Crepidotus variabilis]
MSTTPYTGDGAVDGKDDLYYMDLVEFRVQGGALFRVPTSGFTSSNPNFFKILGVTHQQLSLKSDTHEKIIELSDISRDMFRGLLLAMYPFARTAESYDEWLGALHLSTLWGLSEIRKKAVASISECPEFNSKALSERILLAREYEVGCWLRDAYCQIIQDKNMNVDTLRSSSSSEPLDWETISRLVQAQSLLKVWPADKFQDCEVCLNQQDEPRRKPGYNVNYRCFEHLSARSCVDVVFEKEYTKMGFNPLTAISFAGERLPLTGTTAFPDINQTGPPVSSPSGINVFIASAILGRSVIPCRVDKKRKKCVYFVLGGRERISHSGRFDLLPFSDQHLHWVKASHGQIPVNTQPVEGGHEEDGRLLYHASAFIEGYRIPGKTGLHLGGAKVPWYDCELIFTKDYEILCWRSR